MLRLLADCGNTTLKLGVAEGSTVLMHERFPFSREGFEQFRALHAVGASELILLPGNRQQGELVRSWWGAQPLRVIGEDLRVPDYGQYATCGYDRVLAGAVTSLREKRSLVILDAGTATTLTAWRYVDAQPLFAGGLILPGAQACLDGLVAAAPALPQVTPLGPDASACQTETRGAIAAAMGIGYGPLVAACLLKLERETGIHDVVATGGNIGLIVASRILPASAHRPALVLSGMADLAERHSSAESHL